MGITRQGFHFFGGNTVSILIVGADCARKHVCSHTTRDPVFKEKSFLCMLSRHGLRLHTAETEVDRSQLGWRKAEDKVVALELELEKLNESRARMMTEARETEYQVR